MIGHTALRRFDNIVKITAVIVFLAVIAMISLCVVAAVLHTILQYDKHIMQWYWSEVCRSRSTGVSVFQQEPELDQEWIFLIRTGAEQEWFLAECF